MPYERQTSSEILPVQTQGRTKDTNRLKLHEDCALAIARTNYIDRSPTYSGFSLVEYDPMALHPFDSGSGHANDPHCLVPETVPHFLLACPLYCHHRLRLIHPLGTACLSLRLLLATKSEAQPVLDFVHDTGRYVV
ncbi:hypothetical protein FB451DRAFT_1396315 [Mycena latifolia]|nr:hypothetical protein FB451DRAFT_1396315 [Mycena latifolia]